MQDQLMINDAMPENCKKIHKNLSIAWIDYMKAFNSVPHSWIKCMNMHNVHPMIDSYKTRFIQAT